VQEEEIELIDILRVLWKRKSLIVFGTLLCTVFAAGVGFLLPRVYEVTAIIEPGKRPISDQNGQIVDEKVVESPETIKETVVGGAYNEEIRNSLEIDFDPKIEVSIPKNTSLIEISLESSNPAQASAILEEMVSRIADEIQTKLEIEKKQVENEIRLARIEHQTKIEKIKLLDSQMTEIKGTIQALKIDREKAMGSRPNDAMSVLLYSNEIQNNQIYLNDLQEKDKNLGEQVRQSEIKVENLQQKLLNIKGTKVHKAPTIPEKPVKPKKILIAALAFMLGLMGSTMLAFLLEYLKQAKPVKEDE
jgi:capsular polysaccharide biosynthesis protein